jgi:photosystem II stability/assembly factor-like uncharacterized protein
MKTIIRFLIVSSLVLTQISIAQWVQIGPWDNPALSLAAVNDSIVYTFSQVLEKKMVIGVNKWSPLPNPDGEYLIEQFAARDSMLFACSYHYQQPNGLFLLISTNSGVSWKSIMVDTIIPSAYSEQFTSFEIIGSTLFAGTIGGLYISTDIGRTWDKVSGDSLPGGIGKLKGVGSTLYLAGKGLYKSTDLGKNWQSAGLKDSVLDMIEAKDSKILAGFRGRRSEKYGDIPGQVSLSVDGGINWKTIWSRDSLAPNAITIFANDLYIATLDNRILKSKDAGQTWKNVSNSCTGYGAITFLQHDSSLVAVFSNGVFVSRDGENWCDVTKGLGPGRLIYALAAFDSTLVAGGEYGIDVSKDRGENWKEVGGGKSTCFLRIGSKVLAVTTSGLMISEDQAKSWRILNPDFRGGTMVMDGFTLIASGTIGGSIHDGVIASTDTGRTWIECGAGLPHYISSFAVIDSTIIGDLGFEGIYRSTDHGYSWSPCYSSAPGAILRVFAYENTFFAGSFSDVFRSTDRGNTWQSVYRYPVGVFWISPRSFVQYGSNVIVGFDQGKIAYTPDGGNSWRIVESNLPNEEFDDLVISGNDIFAALWASGVWRRPLSEVVTGVVQQHSEMPTRFSLQQNYPNPFNPSTTIEYSIPQQSHVTVKIFDLLGREVATLVNERKDAGTYSVQWNASGLSSGIYFYRLEANEKRQIKKMSMVK